MKKIIITGSNGLLGSNLCKYFLSKGYEVIGLTSNIEKIKEKIEGINYIENKVFISSNFEDEYFAAINCAFSRSNETYSLLDSLDFADKIYEKLSTMKIKKVINVSSQGVYGSSEKIGCLCNENSNIKADDKYSFAKILEEKLFEKIFEEKNISVCSVRLASVFENSKYRESNNAIPVSTKILEGVWIGANSIILPGVTIGKFSVIGAGSVVTHDVEEYSVYAGNPAKFIRKIKAEKGAKNAT